MIDKLDFLLALARERHFGRAAEACGVTQPTLSAGVKQLEDTMGVLLVNRGSRFMGFTAEGERVLDWARRIVGDARAMREEIGALRRGELSGHLRIAVVPTALGMVAALTTPFRARHPDVRFTILSRTSIQILSALENLEIDAGISYLDNEPLGRVRTVPLYEERYCLVTAASSPLGDRDRVTWAEVGRIPLCLLTRDMQNRRIIDGVFKTLGEMPVPVVETNSFLTSMAHVAHGGLSSIIPQIVVDLFGVPPGTHALPLKDPVVERPVALVVSNRNPLPPISLALLAISLPGATSEQN